MAESWHATVGTIAVRELAPQPIATLRLRHPSPEDLSRIGALISTPLPIQPNTASGDAVRAIWIGPDEWLIVGGTVSNEAIEKAATDATAVLCVSVGDGRCRFEATGVDAPKLLAKGTSIDLHPAAFAKGSTAMALFAQVNVIIDLLSDPDGFSLIFDIGFRDYLHQWFRDALVEFD